MATGLQFLSTHLYTVLDAPYPIMYFSLKFSVILIISSYTWRAMFIWRMTSLGETLFTGTKWNEELVRNREDCDNDTILAQIIIISSTYSWRVYLCLSFSMFIFVYLFLCLLNIFNINMRKRRVLCLSQLNLHLLFLKKHQLWISSTTFFIKFPRCSMVVVH